MTDKDNKNSDSASISSLIFIVVVFALFISVIIWTCGAPQPPPEGTQFFFGVN
ncbi:MAG: hypothetical protein HYT37_02655 [Candidatus Sungbacteria bacterium]|nr:hypothetical protein [Candidatus Sungbacteria bacterium]